MHRLLTDDLLAWLRSRGRLPLVLRGARQVGKTWLVRDLAQQAGLELIECNFEREPRRAGLFAQGDARQIVADLAVTLGREIRAERVLLFLDEVQAAPAVLGSLRWFAEQLPELPVVAAGSLLEFALSAPALRMPVGRVTYRHLEPLGFREYLLAHDQGLLLERLLAWRPGAELAVAVHESGSRWYERFAVVGGMPAVVAADVAQDGSGCRRLQTDLVTAFRDDFARYVGRIEPGILGAVLESVAAQLGRKFVYARVGDGVKQVQARNALELLARARVATLVAHSQAAGIPLGGAVHSRNRKVLLLDVGLAHALFGTPAAVGLPAGARLSPQVRGPLAEQLAGQQLRALEVGDEPSLHYWQQSGGRAGEIDFLVQIGHAIVPVELKAGAAGAMKSLHQFVHDRQLALALRVDANPPSLQQIDVKTTQGDPVRYLVLNLPGYLLWHCRELLLPLTPS